MKNSDIIDPSKSSTEVPASKSSTEASRLGSTIPSKIKGIRLRVNTLANLKQSDVPSELQSFFAPDFPIALIGVTLSEMTPQVVSIIQNSITQPYHIDVLRAFRNRIYDSVYSSNIAQEKQQKQSDYSDLDFYEGDNQLDLGETGIDGLNGIISLRYPAVEKSLKPIPSTAEAKTKFSLMTLDELIAKLAKAPEIIHDDSFRGSLDREVKKLCDIQGITVDSCLNDTFRLKERSLHTLPMHVVPAVAFQVHPLMLSVRLKEQRDYIVAEFGSRKTRYEQRLDQLKGLSDIADLEIKKHIQDHFNKLNMYNNTITKGGSQKIGRLLNTNEFRLFRSSLQQFDRSMSQLFGSEMPTHTIEKLLSLD